MSNPRDGLHQKAWTTLVLVGQAPGKHPKYRPEMALFWYPQGSTGSRLCEKLCLPRRTYTRLERHNVLDFYPGALPGGGDHFPRGMAREAAAELGKQLIGKHVILVGQATALAFGMSDKQGHAPFTWYCSKAYNMAFIPHLSGINRWWNDAANAVMGDQWLYEVGQAWLQTDPMFQIPDNHQRVFRD